MIELAAPWAVRWVMSAGYGRRVALGPTQSRLFGELVSRLGSDPGSRDYLRLPAQRELGDVLGLTVGRVADTLADLARLGIIDLRTLRGCRGATFVRWTFRRWATRLQRLTRAPASILGAIIPAGGANGTPGGAGRAPGTGPARAAEGRPPAALRPPLAR